MKHRPQARERQTKARARYPETGLTQCNIVQIIRRDLGLKRLSFTNTLVAHYC